MKPTDHLLRNLTVTVLAIVLGLVVSGCAQEKAPAVCPECEAYLSVVSTLENTCLSGQSAEVSAKVSGALDILKKAASGAASVSAESVRGARRDWDAIVGQEENSEIRDCLKPIQEALLNCVDRCVANKQASLFPPEMELQLKFKSTEPVSSTVLADRLVLGMKSPPRSRPSKQLLLDTDGWFHDDVATPGAGGQLRAVMHRAVKEGYTAPNDQLTELCLKRAPNPPRHARSSVGLICPDTGVCRELDQLDPGWLVPCDESGDTASFFDSHSLGISFIASAKADSTGQVWMVPSVESLAARRAALHDGFTRFSIDAEALGNMDADGVSLDLWVNGVEVRVEGIPGEFLTQTYEPGEPLHLEFGLENLDFVGRNAGCDSVSTELRFWKASEQVGEPIVLNRAYAALRDGGKITEDINGHQISWSASYEPASTPADYRVIVQSFLLPSWDAMEDLALIQRGIDKLESRRTAINGLNLVYDGRPVVAVMRPPLKNPAWGLALGLRQETGQIRFTFLQGEARQFLAFLMGPASDQNVAAAQLIPRDSYIHVEHNDDSRLSNCFG
jgi:hypothetical protein